MRLGLIVNPIAGLGGRVGLKGSDGSEVQEKALALGAQPQSHLRAGLALERLQRLQGSFELFTAPGRMGEEIARKHGFNPHVIGKLSGKITSAEDTIQSAEEMLRLPVDLLLFAGGDGTARDVFTAVSNQLPVLGIPAGVKIQSAVFATHPRTAGEIAAAYIRGEPVHMRDAELLDLDEQAYRNGMISPRLYGYLKVPYRPHLMQNRKVPTPGSEIVRAGAIAEAVVESIPPGWIYILGPGTTTDAIARRLGHPKTLVGVDVYSEKEVLALDVDETRLLGLIKGHEAKIIVTPIGGQGFLFGRGNQQISPAVLRQVGRENILVVSLVEKLNSLKGEPLLVDSGDAEIDEMLAGYLTVITGYQEKAVYPVASASEHT
jgi:predicted polyphosphate/ATP-dependent NAD kinase